MHGSSVQKRIFRQDLQGLRAIAILSVLLAHMGMSLAPGGFVGVDVFFVLSGYLITGLLLGELERDRGILFFRFYVRRLKRLLPALIVMIGISSAMAAWLLSGVEARAQTASAPFAATWTSNLYFAFITLDYFDELAGRDLFLHTWSLGVEEQFYLIWPAILLVLFRIGKSPRLAGGKDLGALLPGFLLIFAASLALSLHWTQSAAQLAFYAMPSRMWQLSLGAIVCLILRRRARNATMMVSRVFAYTSLGTGLFMIIGSAALLSPNRPYPGLWALIPAFGGALVILAGHVWPRDRGNPLASPALVWLGDRSYSLYLWHWPVFSLGFSLGLQGRLLPTLGLLLVSVLAASLSYRFIELPLWKGRWSNVALRPVFLGSVLAMSVSVLALGLVSRQLPQPNAAADISNRWRYDVPAIYRRPCDAWYEHARVEPCIFGAEEAGRTVVLLGDSIGAQWFSLFPALFPAPDWQIVVLTKSSCAMVDEDFYYQRIGKIYRVCTEWRNAVLDRLEEIQPDVIFAGSASSYEFTENQWVEGSARVLERLTRSAGEVYLVPGTPNLGFDGPGCVAREISSEGRIATGACVSKGRLGAVDTVTRYLEEATARFADAHLLDLNDLVCPNDVCSAVSSDGRVVFRDSQHLTDFFVQSQIPRVRERLRRIRDTPLGEL